MSTRHKKVNKLSTTPPRPRRAQKSQQERTKTHHLQTELTASQRTGFTKRRKQIWEALHPEEKSIGATCATTANVSARGRVGEGRPEGFASATAEATGQSKATTNRAIARADALGDEALTKVKIDAPKPVPEGLGTGDLSAKVNKSQQKVSTRWCSLEIDSERIYVIVMASN